MSYRNYYIIGFLTVLLVSFRGTSQNTNNAYQIALLKYSGGGDWYANPTSLPNLIKFCNQNINTTIKNKPATVEPGSPDLFSYPYIHATGHGNILFNDSEILNLRNYMLSGGFIHFDDNYGLDEYLRREIKKIFPNSNLVEIPASHPIFQKPYSFPAGIPKIHEHDGKRPQGMALIYQGRVVCFYTFESDLGNGWEDSGTYAGDSEESRQRALKMGSNLIQYALTQ